MKKFIVASVCTLGLALLGATGYYNNSMNASASETFRTEKNTADTVKNIPGDGIIQSTAQNNTLNNIGQQGKAIQLSSKKVRKANAKKVSKSKKLKKSKTNGFIYQGVNLSGCNSTGDVVKVLQSNGLTNITMNNVKDVQALKDILAKINQKNGTVAQTPTSTAKPTPTAKPTQAPAPTVKPTQTPAPTATTAPTGLSNYASQVLKLVNQERAKAGLPALTTTPALTAAANVRAKEIAKSFSHTRPDGQNFGSALKDQGISYRSAGENIAYGQKTPQEVMNAWMNSSGHRANIMNTGFGKIGIGVYQINGVYYWTQEFMN